jgi:NADH dehydrogenase [ubiquinone] 1 alpha subcomplex assembly factor 7
MIGVWFLNEWLILNQLYGKHMPKTVQMIELGPGRGTLMNDLLRVDNS